MPTEDNPNVHPLKVTKAHGQPEAGWTVETWTDGADRWFGKPKDPEGNNLRGSRDPSIVLDPFTTLPTTTEDEAVKQAAALVTDFLREKRGGGLATP